MTHTRSEIKCSGGTMVFASGSYGFFVKITIASDSFEFESLQTFKTEHAAKLTANECMDIFSRVVIGILTTGKLDVIDSFCNEWQLIKVKEESSERPPNPPKTLH